jgi:predicted GIY-YIG superfamily endonuclease
MEVADNDNAPIMRGMPHERLYCVYILASKIGGTLYVGVTGALVGRIYQHKEKLLAGFTKLYGVHRLTRSITMFGKPSVARSASRSGTVPGR